MEECKKSKGKQKIEIKEIKESKNLYNTFVKRKSGIFKKASELSTLCGARVDILMFSPCGRPFCYGNPSLQSMTRTGLDEGNPLEGGNDDQLVEDSERPEIKELNEKNDALFDQLYVEKAGEKKLKGILKNMDSNDWWEAELQDFNYHKDAKAMEESLTELRNKLTNELSIKENTSNGKGSST
ncbi:hypothetical protein SESBI_32589 [Sesbania bispinosa]|nr:hypothetical protein SESBI_32589 [Sesbania bispinosa]